MCVYSPRDARLWRCSLETRHRWLCGGDCRIYIYAYMHIHVYIDIIYTYMYICVCIYDDTYVCLLCCSQESTLRSLLGGDHMSTYTMRYINVDHYT